MNDNSNQELTPYQRILIAEGLRYLRSSRRFEFRDPMAPPDEQRESDLREIAGLLSRFDNASAVPVAR